MNEETLHRRIQACLALANSSEPAEAAAALRQANALMRRAGLSAADIERATVREAAVAIGRARLLPDYLTLLANLVSDVMACRWLVTAPRTACFIGVGVAPQIAAYAYEVLGRQLLQARAVHRRRRTRGRPNKRTERADAWACGWVFGVRGLVLSLRPERPAVVDDYLTHRYLTVSCPPAKSLPDDAHVSRGYAAGRASGVVLVPGVGHAAQTVPALEQQ